MNFDEIVVKESPGICRCCLSEGCYKDLGSEYIWMNEAEVYADMLLDCFDIGITQHSDGPNGAKRLICEVCITRLRDACNFKKQVLDSEKRFIDMLGRGEFRSKMVLFKPPMELKVESIEEPPEDVMAEDVEYLDDMEYEGNEEDVKVEGIQSTSRATTSENRPLKRGRPKKDSSPTKAKRQKTVKGETTGDEALSKSSMTATKRNRLMKKNAITLLECSNILPFKWHRQNYLCFYCHLTLKTVEEVKQHTREKHVKPNIKSAVSFLRRDEKVKVNVSSIECRLCSHAIVDLNDLMEHLKLHHNRTFNEGENGVIPYKLDDDFQCAICDETFQYFIKLNQHMNEHFGHYICELCGKSFLSSDRLRCHSLCHGSKFSCSICAETFDSLTLRNNHFSSAHNKPKLLKCLYCTEIFTSYSKRKQHHNKAHDIAIPEYKCPVCSKSFQILSKMTVHVKEVHVREKNFSCSLCDSKFFSKTQVQKHMVRHIGEKTHQCGVCKKAYARKQTLRDHMRTHNDDRIVKLSVNF